MKNPKWLRQDKQEWAVSQRIIQEGGIAFADNERLTRAYAHIEELREEMLRHIQHECPTCPTPTCPHTETGDECTWRRWEKILDRETPPGVK